MLGCGSELYESGSSVVEFPTVRELAEVPFCDIGLTRPEDGARVLGKGTDGILRCKQENKCKG
jgi:hypothetical protein